MSVKFKWIIFFIVILKTVVFSNGIYYFDDWAKCELTNCDVVSSPGKVKIIKIFEDEFNNEYNSRWIIENDSQNCSGAYVFYNPGFLRFVSCINTDWYCNYKNAISIHQQVNKNFIVETKMKVGFAPHRWEFAGIFIKSLENNEYVRIGFATDEVNVKIDTQRCNFAETAIGANGEYNFRIEKNDNILKTYYKPINNTDWFIHKTFNDINWKVVCAGLVQFDTSIQYAYSDFDYFHYYGEKTFTAASLVTPAIDLGSVPVGQGILKWQQNIPELNVHINIYSQTSDDGVIWNEPWRGPYNESQYSGVNILSTNKKFIRFKINLSSNDYNLSPELINLIIEYPLIAPQKPVITSNTHQSGVWSNKKNAELSWCCADNNGVTIEAYYYEIDSNPNTNSNKTINNNLLINYLIDGLHTFNIFARADVSNNFLCGEVEQFILKIDTQPPQKPSILYCSHKEFEKSENNNVYFKLFSVDSDSVTTNTSRIKGYSYIISENGMEPDNIVENTSGEIFINNLRNGKWIFKVKAIDNAENSSEILQYYLFISYTRNILSKENFIIYPTIANNEINIKYNLKNNAKKVLLEIRDVSGKIIRTIEGKTDADENILKENINGFANGVYFMKIKITKLDNTEESLIRKFIIKK